MNKPRWSVLVVQLGSEYGFGLLVARCLAQWQGARVHLLTAEPEGVARYSRHVRTFRSCEATGAPDGWEEILGQEARRTRADIVLPVDQEAVRVLTANRDALPSTARLAPMPSIAALERADDKHEVAQLLQALQLPLPRTIGLTRDLDLSAELRAFSFPVLLKPTRRADGRGIKEFAIAATLVEHVSNMGDEPHIVQEFVRGHDLSCNVICDHGRILAHTLQRGFLPVIGPFQRPCGVEFVRHDDTMRSIAKLMSALEWTGVANIDMRFDDVEGRARILEINPRFWGSLLASLCVGVNFAELACRHALDMELPAISFRPGRFILDKRVALRRLLRFAGGDQGSSAAPLHSVLPYVAADPFPDLVLHARRLRGGLLGKRRSLGKTTMAARPRP